MFSSKAIEAAEMVLSCQLELEDVTHEYELSLSEYREVKAILESEGFNGI